MVMKFFHVTQKKNLQRILNEGLIPNRSLADQRFKAVFLWDDLNVAKTVCCPGDVVLEVSIPLAWKMFRMWNGAHMVYEFLVERKIPPTNLKAVYEGGF